MIAMVRNGLYAGRNRVSSEGMGVDFRNLESLWLPKKPVCRDLDHLGSVARLMFGLLRRFLLQFFKPIEHHVDLRRSHFLRGSRLEHQETLAIR